MLKMR
jgi:hypothetical protein